MGSLDLAVQLWSSTFDISMADALIFDVPVELGLELVAVVGSDLFDAERELFDHVIDEVLSVGLSMFVGDIERPDARRVIDSSILEPADLLAALADGGEELDVHLDVMAWHLRVITLGVNFAHAGSARHVRRQHQWPSLQNNHVNILHWTSILKFGLIGFHMFCHLLRYNHH